MAEPLVNPFRWQRASKFCTGLLFFVSAIFLALHYVHLTADFPNHSPWMDWAKYTDEGWYGDAAIRHYQRGQWYVRGDFNPAAALPVWPLIEFAVFRFTGVSLVAARSLSVTIFAMTLAAGFLLLRRWLPRGSLSVPSAAVLLLSVSPFCFVFTRMAILEPLLVLLMLLALLTASLRSAYLFRIAALGLLLPLMVLTKTTAVFLFPAIFWLVWAAVGYRLRPFLRVVLPCAALAAGFWLTYFALFVRPHFLMDYRYLFSANAYTGMTPANAGTVLAKVLADGMWMGLVYPLAVASSLATLLLLRRRTPPLMGALLLWAAGYAAFLAYHNNLQPRYYLVVAVPLTLLLPLTLRELALWAATMAPATRLAAAVGAGCAIVAVAVPDALQTLHYVQTPEYTFTTAAASVKKIVAADHSRNPLVLSISGSDLSLMTGLPSICDDFGTMELAQRVESYRPGWYAAWNQVDDDKMEALAPLYRLVRVAAFPAFDDPERNLLILYRLDPHEPTPRGARRHKPVVPRLLETRMGQQPTAAQLEH